MNLNLRLFLAYFLVIGIGAYLLLNTVMSEIRPGVRQSAEEAMVDMANLLAELVQADFDDPEAIAKGRFGTSIERFLQRQYSAEIYTFIKSSSDLRVYITDVEGIVIYDSSGEALGKDYSLWNDVYLTLQGQYGARSSMADPLNEASSTLFVAAPIYRDGHIVGSLTVAKPSRSVQPFIELAQLKIRNMGLLLLLASLLIGAFLSYWLTRSIRALSRYASAIAEGKRVVLPRIRETELAQLAESMATMREQLEGKNYVENYVHSLTHEIKSPVSAIKGASELLQMGLASMASDADGYPEMSRFASNIEREADRIDELISRLLELAALERRDELQTLEPVDVVALVVDLVERKRARINQRQLQIQLPRAQSAIVAGEAFLLAQAIDNLLNNALDFSPEGATVLVDVVIGNELQLTISDEGPGIPDYAREKIFQRFYSLPRPESGKKSSGLGLNFVQQVAKLHGGQVRIENRTATVNSDPHVVNGTRATLILPI